MGSGCWLGSAACALGALTEHHTVEVPHEDLVGSVFGRAEGGSGDEFGQIAEITLRAEPQFASELSEQHARFTRGQMRQHPVLQLPHDGLPGAHLFDVVGSVVRECLQFESAGDLRIGDQVAAIKVGSHQKQGCPDLSEFGVDVLDVIEDVAAAFPVRLEQVGVIDDQCAGAVPRGGADRALGQMPERPCPGRP